MNLGEWKSKLGLAAFTISSFLLAGSGVSAHAGRCAFFQSEEWISSSTVAMDSFNRISFALKWLLSAPAGVNSVCSREPASIADSAAAAQSITTGA